MVVKGTVVGKDNKEEKTREVTDIRMYHFGWNFWDLICHGGDGCMKILNTFNISDHIQYI